MPFLMIQFAVWCFWCCSWSMLDKSSVATAIRIQLHSLAACLGGLFLVSAVLMIITVAWGALHKHQSVQALVSATNGRWSCEPPHPSDFLDLFGPDLQRCFLAFLRISYGPPKFPRLIILPDLVDPKARKGHPIDPQIKELLWAYFWHASR